MAEKNPATVVVGGDIESAESSKRGNGLHRAMSTRQVSMLAIAGTIGTGLFLGSGKALVKGGPVGALLGYSVVGALVGIMMISLGEMSCFTPDTSNFVGFATRWVDPSLGFALGWMYYIFSSLLVPVEIVAAGIVLQYWDPNTKHLAIFVTVMLAAYVIISFCGSQYFGEVEFWFGLIKVVTLIGLVLLGIVVDLGGSPNHQGRIGFRYWKEAPLNDSYLNIKPASAARFIGIWATFTQAAFSYGGIESLAVMAGEAKGGKKTMARAFKQVFIRIGAIYISCIWIIGMCIKRTDEHLLSALAQGSGTAAQSPFVIICRTAGIKVLPSIINAVVFTSALSSGNEGFFIASRTLYALAEQGHAPRFFLKTTKRGVPYYGSLATLLVGLLAFLNVSSGSTQAFNWLSNLTTLSNMICWVSCLYTYTRFYKACMFHNIDRRTFILRGYCQPYLSWAAFVFFLIIITFNGFASFVGGFNYQDFLAAYITIPTFVLLFFGWKFGKKTKMVQVADIDMSSGF
ncbi:hypothetical protein T439DRAFT_325017 [Meredithblackwellia eburnea MCA 4105]